jgi:hypothetical protein
LIKAILKQLGCFFGMAEALGTKVLQLFGDFIESLMGASAWHADCSWGGSIILIVIVKNFIGAEDSWEYGITNSSTTSGAV